MTVRAIREMPEPWSRPRSQRLAGIPQRRLTRRQRAKWQPPPDDLPGPGAPLEAPIREPVLPERSPEEAPPGPDEQPSMPPPEEPERK